MKTRFTHRNDKLYISIKGTLRSGFSFISHDWWLINSCLQTASNFFNQGGQSSSEHMWCIIICLPKAKHAQIAICKIKKLAFDDTLLMCLYFGSVFSSINSKSSCLFKTTRLTWLSGRPHFHVGQKFGSNIQDIPAIVTVTLWNENLYLFMSSIKNIFTYYETIKMQKGSSLHLFLNSSLLQNQLWSAGLSIKKHTCVLLL